MGGKLSLETQADDMSMCKNWLMNVKKSCNLIQGVSPWSLFSVAPVIKQVALHFHF